MQISGFILSYIQETETLIANSALNQNLSTRKKFLKIPKFEQLRIMLILIGGLYCPYVT